MERENGSCSELRPSIFFRVQSLKCVITRGVLQRRSALSENWFEALLSAFASQDRQKPMGLWLAAVLSSPPCHPDYFLPAWILPKLSFQQAELFGEKSCLLMFGFGWIGQIEKAEEEERGRRMKMWTRKMNLFFYFVTFTFFLKSKISKHSRVY